MHGCHHAGFEHGHHPRHDSCGRPHGHGAAAPEHGEASGCCPGEHGMSKDERIQVLARHVSFMKDRLEHLEKQLAELGGAAEKHDTECDKG